MRYAMTRFPVLTFIGKLLRWVAIACPVVGFLALISGGRAGILVFVASLLIGLGIWIYAELTGIVLSIESNTHEAMNHLETLVRLAEQADQRSRFDAQPRTPIAPVQSIQPPIVPAEPTWMPVQPGQPAPSVRQDMPSPTVQPLVAEIVPRPTAPSASPNPDTTQPSEASKPTGYRTVPKGLTRPVHSNELTISGSGRSPNSLSAALAYDKDLGSFWVAIGSTPPQSAFVSFDLGAIRAISGIVWMFAESGYAAGLAIQVSDDHYAWRTVATPGDAPANEWQQISCSERARYVRFYFANPNHQLALGYLGDVQILGAA